MKRHAQLPEPGTRVAGGGSISRTGGANGTLARVPPAAEAAHPPRRAQPSDRPRPGAGKGGRPPAPPATLAPPAAGARVRSRPPFPPGGAVPRGGFPPPAPPREGAPATAALSL